MEATFADTAGTELSEETYRQTNYVNDINCENTRVLMEYTGNGNRGTSTTAYSYGIQRESCSITETARTAGNTMESVTARTTGTYYYTGTGNVSNLISSKGNSSYTYTPNGQMSAYAMDSPGQGNRGNETTAVTGNYSNGTYGIYGYKGEYTHTNLGLQYLRARYYHMATGTFTSKDTYAGTLTDILSQNRYTYAENNPVTYSDPSGHAAKKSAMASVLKNAVTSVKNVTPKLTTTRLSSLAENIRISNGSGNSSTKTNVSTKPSLLENIRVYNTSEYYNNLLLWTPIPTLMSDSGGKLTFAESVAAKEEAARCMGYSYTNVGKQKEIEYDEVIIRNREYEYFIPGTVVVIALNTNTNKITEYINHPAYNWGAPGMGDYEGQPMLNPEGKYRIAAGPGIVDPDYPVSGQLHDEDYKAVKSITIVIENMITGKIEYKECEMVDFKGHTYNMYSDGHKNSDLPYVVVAYAANGLVQTGISYPKSDNAKKSLAFAPNDVSGMVIEFATETIDFDANDYRLREIIVNTQ